MSPVKGFNFFVSYEFQNILVYFMAIPLLWCLALDYKLNRYFWLTGLYLLFVVAFFLTGYQQNTKYLYWKGIDFCVYWQRFGYTYAQSCIVWCIMWPLVVTIAIMLLPNLRRSRRVRNQAIGVCLAILTISGACQQEPHTRKEIVVFHQTRISETYFEYFKRRGFTIRYVQVKPKFDSYQATALLTRFDDTTRYLHTYRVLLLDHDIFHPAHGVSNYRIRGLSFLSGNVSIISHRNLKPAYLQTVILHEFGHAKGLRHCTHRHCIMNDAKGKMSNLRYCRSFKQACAVDMKRIFN